MIGRAFDDWAKDKINGMFKQPLPDHAFSSMRNEFLTKFKHFKDSDDSDDEDNEFEVSAGTRPLRVRR
jgi:hypothetical protein